jgi:hypothetical protein
MSCASAPPQKPLTDTELNAFVAALDRSAVPEDHPEFTYNNPACAVYFKDDFRKNFPFSTEEVVIAGRPDQEHWKVKYPDGRTRTMPRNNVVCLPCKEAIPQIFKLIKEWKVENGVK